jgi:hypothetical protein
MLCTLSDHIHSARVSSHKFTFSQDFPLHVAQIQPGFRTLRVHIQPGLSTNCGLNSARVSHFTCPHLSRISHFIWPKFSQGSHFMCSTFSQGFPLHAVHIQPGLSSSCGPHLARVSHFMWFTFSQGFPLHVVHI